MRNIVTLFLLLFLAACERGPQAPTQAQNDQMNDAEAALDDMAANGAPAN